jgi:hypothetical protein
MLSTGRYRCGCSSLRFNGWMWCGRRWSCWESRGFESFQGSRPRTRSTMKPALRVLAPLCGARPRARGNGCVKSCHAILARWTDKVRDVTQLGDLAVVGSANELPMVRRHGPREKGTCRRTQDRGWWAPTACSGLPPSSFDNAPTSSGLALAAAVAASATGEERNRRHALVSTRPSECLRMRIPQRA